MRSLYLVLAVVLALGATSAFGQIRPRRFQSRILGGSVRQQSARQSSPARSGPQPHPWNVPAELPPALKLALTAVGRIRYTGIRVIQTKSGPNRPQHTEYVFTNGPETRIEFPKDSPLYGQVIVENATERRQFLPGRNEIQVGPPQRDEAFLRLATMVANRSFIVNETPGGSIAGLVTELVAISDRKGNVLQKLWIEPHSGMILKRELYDRLGTLQASSEFTQVDLKPNLDPSYFHLAPKGVPVITPDDILTRIIKRQGFRDVRLPAGTPYRLEAARMQKISEQLVLVQQYAGNGHRITLYQLKSAVDPAQLQGLVRPNLRIYSWQTSGSSFVLMGDLSDAELRDLARRLGG